MKKEIRNSVIYTAGAALALVACTSSDTGPASVKLMEAETTYEIGGSTTVERKVFSYQGDQITEVRYFRNGEVVGRRELSYMGKNLAEITSYDEDGDRSTETWTYVDGRLDRQVLVVPESFTNDARFEYERDGSPREITNTRTRYSSEDSTTRLIRFDYNEGALAEMTTIEDGDTGLMEFDYDVDSRLRRTISYQDGRHLETLEFEYDAETGALAEFVDKENNRTTFSYDDEGRIARVQELQAGGGTSSTRYTYGEGSSSGLSIAPSSHPMFDLRGNSHSRFYAEHVTFPKVADFPTPSNPPSGGGGSGGGGGGGGSGGGGPTPTSCEQFEADGFCQQCGYDFCCEELLYCADNQSCLDYDSCLDSCSDSDCANACAAQYPTGANLLENWWSCNEVFCSDECGL